MGELISITKTLEREAIGYDRFQKGDKKAEDKNKHKNKDMDTDEVKGKDNDKENYKEGL